MKLNADKTFKIILAQPRGFCAGVERAIAIAEATLAKYGAPIYVRQEIVHNRFVVESLKAKGVIFVDEIDKIPEGAVAIFSAHGVSDKVENDALARGLNVIDATCPLVTKVHNEARRYDQSGYKIILIGHEGHPEVEGTSGKVNGDITLISSLEEVDDIEIDTTANYAFVTQTTLSIDDTSAIINRLKARIPNIIGPDTKDICYATQNRQDAVRILAQQVNLLIVLGAKASSNSNRLLDLGESLGTKTYLIDDEGFLTEEMLGDANTVGITAGASAPEILVQRVVDKLRSIKGNVTIETMAGKQENIHFNIPKDLREYVSTELKDDR